jgi:predicted deacylase
MGLMRSVLIAVGLFFLWGPGLADASSRAPFAIAGQQVAAGQRVHIDIPIPAGSDPETYVPVTVFHGAGEGPALALTMGVHGYEFPSILAGQRLLDRIDPATLRGTVILVRISHVAAFEQRAPFVNPHDRKNLNRVFPGRADGTQAERIAWALTTEVIRRADVHVDLHSGDGAEWLEAFVGIYGGKLADRQYATSRKVGLAFGFQNVDLRDGHAGAGRSGALVQPAGGGGRQADGAGGDR